LSKGKGLKDLFRLQARIFPDRTQPPANAKLGLRPIDQVGDYSYDRRGGRGNRQTEHPNGGDISPVFGDLICQYYSNSATDRCLGDCQQCRCRERKNDGLKIIARHKTVLLC
jgi:hypothetical protein